MGSTWGNNYKLSLFGESHGECIGIVIDGLPSGIELDLDMIKSEMDRRRPGKSKLSTKRNEADEFNIVSGFFKGKTTGAPLCCIIYNNNRISNDYEKMKHLMRPGHADYTALIKYKGHNDYRGGGHFSGRLTAPLTFAGAIAKQLLKLNGITIGSHIKSIKEVEDNSFDLNTLCDYVFKSLSKEQIPVLNKDMEVKMKEVIINAADENDSVGGIIETAVINIPAGIGDPFFNSIESTISHLVFSIPAVKGIEFGEGFDITRLKGSEANDNYYLSDNKVNTKTNNNGGILGGITNGMPIIFKTAIKPTPSIGKVQKTVDISKKKETELTIRGRHDPCIVQRALPVIEGVTAIGLVDLIIKEDGFYGFK